MYCLRFDQVLDGRGFPQMKSRSFDSELSRLALFRAYRESEDSSTANERTQWTIYARNYGSVLPAVTNAPSDASHALQEMGLHVLLNNL